MLINVMVPVLHLKQYGGKGMSFAGILAHGHISFFLKLKDNKVFDVPVAVIAGNRPNYLYRWVWGWVWYDSGLALPAQEKDLQTNLDCVV